MSALLFLRFRLRQLAAILKEINKLYLIVIILALIGVIGAMFNYSDSETAALVEAGLIWAIILTVHFRRKDYHFIHLAAGRAWIVFALDYVLLSSPAWIMSGIHGYMYVSALTILACIVTGFVKYSGRRRRKTPVPAIIPVHLFELRAGFRQSGAWLVILYILAALSSVIIPVLPFVFLWFSVLLIMEYYKPCEAVGLLCAKEMGARKFLRYKLGANLRFYLTFLAPVCLASAFCDMKTAWLPCTFLFLSLLSISFFIIIKYAYFQPGSQVESGQIPAILSLFGIIIPVIAPVTIIFLIHYYNKAIRTLKIHLHAYD
jgi:hypothetical protein